MFVGEGPGADEDRQGEPFVGRAGQLLTKMIGAMGLSRSDVYIANVVKCRPPGNRDPVAAEVAECRPFLDKQIAAVSPEAIVCLGRVAASTLLDRNVGIIRERGTWTSYQGVPMMLTLHPAYLLRQEQAKAEAWADLQLVMKRLGLNRPGGNKR
ncbi:MAG: DNA polymerase [Bradymonadia bacterium]|jgi:DNA polymerase